MNAQALIQALNSNDFRAFTRKNDETHKKVTLSFRGEDNKRYFVTRVATSQIDSQGRPVYMWATGRAMRNITQ